jgi:signal transduction histidine kinase/HAMP domain-containing protein
MAENKNDVKKRQSVYGKLRNIGKNELRYSIGVRFFSFVVLIALLSGGVVGFVMVRTSRDYLRRQALQNNLNQANLAASFASNYIAAVEAHVKVFATRPDIVQAVFNGQAAQLQPTLAEFVQVQTALNGVGIYDISGTQLSSSLTGAANIGQSFINRNWFQGVIATGQPYLGTPTLAQSNNVPVETYAVPIIDNQGNIRAVLAAGMSLTQLSNALVNIGYNADTQAVLIDTRNGGNIIADDSSALLLTAPVGDTQAVNQLLTGKSGSLATTGSNGKQDLTGFAAVPGLPWGIMVETPSSAAFSILTSLTERAVIYTVLIILLAGIFGVFLVLGITRPLNRLMADTKEIGAGNLDVKLETAAKDEIGDLSRAFGEMTVKLKSTMVSRDDLITEVTERKQAEEKLKNQFAILKGIIESPLTPIFSVDEKYRYTSFNSIHAGVIKSIYGTDIEVGKSILDYMLVAKDRDIAKANFDRALNGEHFSDEAYSGEESLKRSYFIVSHNPVRNDEGRIIGVVVFAQDMTERKLLEQEKDKYTKELAEKNIELERFTYTVSHDLKSPLVTIKTFLGYLPQDMTAADKQRVEKDLLFMNNAADKMGLLLQELLEMSRIGRIINPPVKITFAELIKEAISIVAGSIADRGVKVQVGGESVTLYGDRSRLTEIWQNLLENAVKFIGDRSSPQIDIGVERHGSETVFFVRDNGIGIDPQYQSKIFNLFEKIEAKTEGTGMGLAIVKRIVELYQGRIWVESKGLGQGTSFFFTLPGALSDKDKGGSA